MTSDAIQDNVEMEIVDFNLSDLRNICMDKADQYSTAYSVGGTHRWFTKGGDYDKGNNNNNNA